MVRSPGCQVLKNAAKGWFKVIPDEDLDADEYDDAAEHWYYADGDGALYANEIKTINGRKYAFDEYGRMVDGLRLIEFDKEANGAISTKKIVAAYEDDDNAALMFDTEDNLDATIQKIMSEKDTDIYSFMYFGDADDGAVKTGKQKIDIDGDEIEFEFKKDGSKKGQGRNEVDKSDKVAYAMGKRYKADSDNKYEIVLELKYNTEDKKGTSLVSVTTEEYIQELMMQGGEDYKTVTTLKSNGDEEDLFYYGKDGQKLLTKWDDAEITNTYVVNTSGSLVKTKSKCTDGDDYVIKVKNFDIEEIYEELD